MKKTILFILSLCLLVGSSIFVKYTIAKTKTPVAEAKVSYSSNNIKQLAKDSQLIITGTVGNDKNIITFHNIKFVISSLNVSDSLKGNILSNSKINILQTKDLAEDPELQPNQKVLLFLEKYDGAITDNAYVIKGLYQGNYKINNGLIQTSKNNNVLGPQMNGKKLGDIKTDLVTAN